MRSYQYTAPAVSHGKNPDEFLTANCWGGKPHMNFKWIKIGEKRRLIGSPNNPMRNLHGFFVQYVKNGIMKISDSCGWRLQTLPSSTAFVKESNPLINASKHLNGKFFYITDMRDAYLSINLEKLAVLILYIRKYEHYQDYFNLNSLALESSSIKIIKCDPLFPSLFNFIKVNLSGMFGEGLAVGGPASPFLVNLYCEVFIDGFLRKLCDEKEMVYTRYADDFVFSRDKPIISEIRREIRKCITRGGVNINHRKSFVQAREMGTVFVTKTGLLRNNEKAKLVFPQVKRRKLHGIIKSYLKMKMDWPERVSGYVAEFIYYFKNVETPTATDMKTFALCKEFEKEWSKYKKPWNH